MTGKKKEKKTGDIKKKERKYFGIMDFEEHTSKWLKVFMGALVVLVLVNVSSMAYTSYSKNGCGSSGCAETQEDEKDVIQKEVGKQMTDLGQSYELNEVVYKLNKLDLTGEYALIGWDSIKQGNRLKEIIQGVEEKELIPTGQDDKYIFVWGEKETELIVEENGKEIERFGKEEDEILLLEIQTKNSSEIIFK